MYLLFLKKFKMMVEKHHGSVIKILGTDGGGEYISHEFQKVKKKELYMR